MSEESKYMFQTRMEVRDYECDIQGIVNNANYLHYLEHTRHRFLRSRNVSFAELHEKGVDVVVARMELQYKVPLRCDDEFISCLNVTKEGIRYVFKQDIFRASDNKLCIRAKVELVGLRDGKLAMTPEYDVLLTQPSLPKRKVRLREDINLERIPLAPELCEEMGNKFYQDSRST